MKNTLDMYRMYGEKIYQLCHGVIGYMIPAEESGKRIERTLIRYSDAGNRRRPFAWAGFDMETGMLLYYKHCSMEDFIDTNMYPADTALGKSYKNERTPKEQIKYEKALWESYESIREFVFLPEISRGHRELVRRFKAQWEMTVLKDLVPYYEALSPEFFAWMKEFNIMGGHYGGKGRIHCDE